MIDKKLSSRYAKALLGICEDEQLDEDMVLGELKSLKGFFEDNPKVLECLSAYVIPYQRKSKLIEQISDNKIVVYFLNYLAKRGRFQLFPEIVDTFEELVDERKGRVKVFVRSAIELDEQIKQKLQEMLTRKLNKTIQPTFTTDSSLLAGIIVQVKDVVYDGSLKTYLSNLEQKLMRLSL